MERSLLAALRRCTSLWIVAGVAFHVSVLSADEPAVFLKPVRLQADGADIDTGEQWGHSGPAMADVDGDGLRDLVVGDFSGKFHFYKNVGSDKQPKFTASGNLQAAGEDAKVPIYCCIGSSPHFVDFDQDGKLDLISGSYDPGECYLFRGLGDGKFAARETVVDKTGKPILRNPEQKYPVHSFGSWPVMIDWNNDGKADLLIGGFDGTMFVHLNEGSPEKPAFAIEKIVVQAAGKDLKVGKGEMRGHAAPAVADWDGDGHWDILAGAEDGGVYFFRNVGEPGAPQFAEPAVLVGPHDGWAWDDLLEVGAEPVPGIRSQIAAVDYNLDGKTDLLLGDFSTTVTPRSDLTAAERQEFDELRKKNDELLESRRKLSSDLNAEFAKRFPGDAIYSDEGSAAWQKAYKAKNDSDENKAREKLLEDVSDRMSKFVVKPNREGTFTKFATTRGYVWLFERK